MPNDKTAPEPKWVQKGRSYESVPKFGGDYIEEIVCPEGWTYQPPPQTALGHEISTTGKCVRPKPVKGSE